ncbi:unnamed protein product, partial [Chrysoparadoxa australica]
ASEDKERLIYLRDRIIEQIKNLIGKESKTEFFLLIAITFYFLISNGIVDDISIGPFQIINSDFALIFIPPVFSFLLLRLILLHNIQEVQKNNLTKVLEKLDNGNNPKAELRILLPFQIFSLFDIIDFGKSRIWSFVLLIALFPVIYGVLFFFFGIQFYWLLEVIPNWNQDWFFKTSIISTIW